MDKCTDENIGKKLYAYELGQLPENECREVEVHLFECEFCYRRSLKFQDSARMIRGDNEVRGELELLSRETSDGLEEATPIETKRWPKVVRLSLAAAAVLVILLLRPWNLEFQPTKEAVAFENILAVMYFDNLAEVEEDSRLGEIISDLVITDMASSDYLNVMSSQRLYDILKLMGREGLKKIDQSIATEVAYKGRARWMLTGSILQEEPSLVLSTQIVDVRSGNVIGAKRIEGRSRENIFEVVDRLTSEVRSLLSIPNEEIHKHDRAVADITTSSREAYKYYIEGVNYLYRGLFTDARIALEKAQKLDSAFAMAYYMWTRAGLIENDNDRKAAIDAAMKYIDRTNDIQTHYIKARHAEIYEDYETAIKEYKTIIEKYPDEKLAYYFLGVGYHETGGYQSSIEMLLKAVEIDPMFKRAYRALYSRYKKVGQQDRADWALDKYSELAPDDPGPYYTRGNKSLDQGLFNEALAYYDQALEIAPDQIGALIHIGNIYHFKRDFVRADSVYNILTTNRKPETRAHARARLTQTQRAQGKFKEALEMIEKAIEDDKKDIGPSISLGRKYALAGSIYGYFLREYDKAIEYAKKDMEIEGQVARSYFANMAIGNVAWAYAMKGDFEKSDSILGEVKAYYDESNLTPGEEFIYYLALVEHEKGNYDSAIACLQSIVDTIPVFGGFHTLAQSHYAAGNIDSAIANFERAFACYDRTRAESAEFTALAEYELGLAYEVDGRTRMAITQYQKFLDLWKDADPGLWMVNDARKRLNQLRNKL